MHLYNVAKTGQGIQYIARLDWRIPPFVNRFHFRIFSSANLWLGTDIQYKLESEYFNLEVTGQTDVFFAIPSISSVSNFNNH